MAAEEDKKADEAWILSMAVVDGDLGSESASGDEGGGGGRGWLRVEVMMARTGVGEEVMSRGRR